MQNNVIKDYARRMEAAERLAISKGERFTAIRRHIYKSMLESDQPLGAYEILDLLAGVGSQKPPTVYRALEWLSMLGLIRKVASISKYIALPQGQSHDPVAVLICRDCGKVDVMETSAPVVQLMSAAQSRGYKELEATLEIVGQCSSAA